MLRADATGPSSAGGALGLFFDPRLLPWRAEPYGRQALGLGSNDIPQSPYWLLGHAKGHFCRCNSKIRTVT